MIEERGQIGSRVPAWARHPATLGVVGVLGSLLVTGFDVIGPDQQLYVPFLKKWANPSLYPGDLVFAGTNFHATLFVPVFGAILRVTRSDVATLQTIGYVLSLFLLMSGAAAVVSRVAPWPAALWATVLLWWPPPLPGAGDAFYEPSFHPHTLGVGLAVWSLAQLLAARGRAAVALAVAAALFHPLAGLAALLGGVLGSAALGARVAVRWSLAAGCLLVIAHLVWPQQRSHLPLRPVDWWIAVADAGYLWSSHWSKGVFVSLGLWLGLAAASWRTRGDRTLRCLACFGAAGLVLFGSAIVGMWLRSPLLVSLQLHRGFFVFELVTIVFVARRLASALSDGRLSWIGWLAIGLVALCRSAAIELGTLAAALALAAAPWPAALGRWMRHAPIVACVLVLLAPRHTRFSLPTPQGWLALQDWARRNTPIDARFLVPARYPDFRVFSDRSSVLGGQDGAPAIFDEDLAHDVAERQPIGRAYEQHDCRALWELAKRFGARYLVTEERCDELPLRTEVAGYYIHDTQSAR